MCDVEHIASGKVVQHSSSVRTVERGIQSEHNPFDSIVIPTNVYCSLLSECYHTSRKCEGLQNVPTNGIRRRLRVCIAYSETDDEMENSMNDELERRESIALGPVHLSWALRVFKYLRQSGTMLWLPRRQPTYRARGNDYS